MNDKILDGVFIAGEIKSELALKVADRLKQGKRPPHLVAVLIGEDGGSLSYVQHKVNDCAQVGFTSTVKRFPADYSEASLMALIAELNANKNVDGCIVQLPLPAHISVSKVIEAIHPSKDVDGFHPVNLGRMMVNVPGFVPATPWGILQLLKRSGVGAQGEHIVVVGRSQIVGSPLSVLLSRDISGGNATVTLAHRYTRNLEALCREADILITAIGKPAFFGESYVKEGAVVVDVGTTRVADAANAKGWRLSGDVNFERVYDKVSKITPVPGGVGPMTRVGLLHNTWLASENILY
jgi:methylenetetrahydrofolate dehydrogenase (NADP+) / methenyltetrahydrofolate cyclohydrolase